MHFFLLGVINGLKLKLLRILTPGRFFVIKMFNLMSIFISIFKFSFTVNSKANLSVLHQDLRSYLTRVAVLTSLLLMQWLLLICSFG